MAFPIRTARENPIRGSKGELPEMFCRCGICGSDEAKNPPRGEASCGDFASVCITQILRAQRQRSLIRWRYATAGMTETRFLKPFLFQKDDQIADPVGVAPLIVVPGDDLAVLPITLVSFESTMEESGLPLKSAETSSALRRRECPSTGLRRRALKAALTILAP